MNRMASTTRQLAIALASVACFATGLYGQPQQAPQPPAPTMPKGQTPILGRPTKTTDPMPVFNFDQYFLGGKWTCEAWDFPDSVLGPGGTITASAVYKALGGGFYQADITGTGPSGPVKMKEVYAYLVETKTVSRYVTDGRGFEYMQISNVGGDLGGYFNLHFQSAPFTFQGKTIRISNWMRLLSPVQYKSQISLSVDGGPEQAYGVAWWRKQYGDAPSK